MIFCLEFPLGKISFEFKVSHFWAQIFIVMTSKKLRLPDRSREIGRSHFVPLYFKKEFELKSLIYFDIFFREAYDQTITLTKGAGYMFWLPQPLYTAKPVFFLLAALSLMLITKNMIVTMFAICLTGYALWILFARFTWRDTGFVE